jgi:putative ABC transport system permease protein
MLELKDIKKDYQVADEEVHALKGISLNFRKNEFVSILGPSGCGKTTLLNIIGGLDKYTSGDLIIEGVSTKQYNDRDWDTYRNHSIGFIFQSYHLIPHQTILQNVELALMISGVSKRERRRRALEALDRVGLKDKIHNRPNQLSGGQAQRVAIARALINDPEIVLADEPTGALDSKTSVQIMDLLKEISKDRLVIMVTHNPELAEQYSTRIIRLLDGVVTGDSKPYDGSDEDYSKLTKKELKKKNRAKGSRKKTKMSPLMAMSLSCKNLLSKRKRTTMVSVAGSIGIIGVSMVLAISAGVQNYINTMEDDMLSGNPVSVTQSAIDFSSLMTLSSSSQTKVDITKLNDKLYVKSLMDTLGNFSSGFSKTNTLTDEYLYYLNNMPEEYYNVIQYGYEFDAANNIYTNFKVQNSDEGKDMSVTGIRAMYSKLLQEQEDYKNFAGTISTVATFDEMPDNYEYILSQYDILAAVSTASGEVTYNAKDLSNEWLKSIFSDKQTLVMVVNDNEVTDLVMGQFGYLTQSEFMNYAYKAVDSDLYNSEIGLVGSGGEDDPATDGSKGLDMSRFIGSEAKTFTWYSNDEVFTKMGDTYVYRPYVSGSFYALTDDDGNVTYKLPVGDIDTTTTKKVDLQVKIILQKKSDISYGCLDSGIYYTKSLTDYIREDSKESEIVKYIDTLATTNSDGKKCLTALPYSFEYSSYEKDEATGEYGYVTRTASSAFQNTSGILDMLMVGLSGSSSVTSDLVKVTAEMLGGGDNPSAIYFYPVNFDYKNNITDYLDEWNAMCERGDTYNYVDINGAAQVVTLAEKDKITYTDNVGLIINMVNTMIQMITIALVAFTALSLVVSTVMIGIITYVSVVERVKEIGILRAVGARKRDIKRLFNAETFIIGLVAGLFGIAITYLLSLIVNVVVLILAGVWGIAALPWWEALVMIALSVVLTLISGLIPASAAAKKDPVVALRTE